MQGNCIEVTAPIESDMHNMCKLAITSLWSKNSSHGIPKWGPFSHGQTKIENKHRIIFSQPFLLILIVFVLISKMT